MSYDRKRSLWVRWTTPRRRVNLWSSSSPMIGWVAIIIIATVPYRESSSKQTSCDPHTCFLLDGDNVVVVPLVVGAAETSEHGRRRRYRHSGMPLLFALRCVAYCTENSRIPTAGRQTAPPRKIKKRLGAGRLCFSNWRSMSKLSYLFVSSKQSTFVLVLCCATSFGGARQQPRRGW